MNAVRLAAVVLVAFGADAGVASSVNPQPLSVRSSSLSQDGQQLVWRVQMKSPFSPAAMKRAGQELCLVVERAANSSVSGVLCVAPPRNGRSPALVYMPVTARGRGLGHVIDATVSRSSDANLVARFLPSAIATSYRAVRWQILTTVGAPSCMPAATACQSWFPTRPILTRLHTPRLVGCVAGGASFVTNGPRDGHVIALTFDDGPWPDTPQFLNVLEREHVHATFFQIGRQVSTYGPGVDNRMLDDGDVIGDHTWDHADVAGAGGFAAGEIASTASAIHHLTGFSPCLFRAPGGAVSSALISEARSMGFITIQWDVDPRDWARPGTGAIYATVTGTARNGSIVIQHDGGGDRSETLAALPAEIHFFKSRGYQFVTIPELLGLQLIYK